METLNIADVASLPGAGHYNAKSLIDTDLFGMVHFSLPPGGIIPMHNMPFEVCFLVLSGKGTLTVNDENFNVSKNYRMICPPQIRRGWRNYGTEENLNILVIKIKTDSDSLHGTVTDCLDDTEPVANPHGVCVQRVYDGDHALANMITLKPGEQLLRHITPVDVFFFSVSGMGTLEIAEEERTIRPGSFIHSPKGVPHCWYNRGDADLRIFVLKIPRPTTPTQFV